jgi:hypothetical protein
MRTKRAFHSTVSYHSKLYVIGGSSTLSRLGTVEVFDFAMQEWSMIPCQMTTQHQCATVVHGVYFRDKLHAIGGYTPTKYN